MKRTGVSVAIAVIVALLSTATAAAARDEADEFHAHLLPEIGYVYTDSLIEIEFAVDSTAKQFNGYEVTLQFDPELVAFEGVTEGSLMVSACDQRFTDLATTDSTVTYVHVLLCGGVSVDGPGVLSVHRFRGLARGLSALEITSDPDRTFYDGGLFVWPQHPYYPRQVILHDAELHVLNPSAVDESCPEREGLRAGVWPNPIRPGTPLRWSVTGVSGPITIAICDATGRRLGDWRMRLGGGDAREAGSGALEHHTGILPAGVYYYTVRSGRERAVGRFLVVR